MLLITLLLNVALTTAQAASLRCVIVTEQNGVKTEVDEKLIANENSVELKYENYSGVVKRKGVTTTLILHDKKTKMSANNSFEYYNGGSSDLINAQEKVSLLCDKSASKGKKSKKAKKD